MAGTSQLPIKEVYVVGSLNWDIVSPSNRRGSHSHQHSEEWGRWPGGHGFNQAISVYRASHDRPPEDASGQGGKIPPLGHGLAIDIKVHVVGKIGTDEDGRGEKIRTALVESHINIDAVKIHHTMTGYANIYVDKYGAPEVHTTGGANNHLDWHTVHGVLYPKSPALILVQLEIPIETAFNTILYARKKNIPVIFNPAPKGEALESYEGIFDVDHLILNRVCADLYKRESELDEDDFISTPWEDIQKRYLLVCSDFHKDGAACVVITLGARGVVASYLEPPDNGGKRYRKTWSYGAKIGPNGVQDQTGASDAFIGAYAVEILQQLHQFGHQAPRLLDIGAAIYMGIKAGGLTVSGRGSVAPMPWRNELVGQEYMFQAVEDFHFE